MSTVLEKARGAAVFHSLGREIPDFTENSAARFNRRPNAREWDARMAQLKSFRSLDEDWDGDGSCAPGPDLTDAAIALAQSLQKQGAEPPGRVVVGVNGTIFFEWHESEEYRELEVLSPDYVEARSVRTGSD